MDAPLAHAPTHTLRALLPTYRDVSDFRPWKASGAMSEI